MITPSPKEVTTLLREWSSGNRQALDQLMPLVYDELRRLADGYLRRERSDHTLQPTALVHEAYLRLVDMDVPWQDRAHFFAVAARLMRRILVDHAKSHHAAKRGGGERKVPLEDAAGIFHERPPDIVALDDALTALAAFDSRRCEIIELRFFGGLTTEEMAEVLHLSTATVERDLKLAKAWLYKTMMNAG